jgi:hypothetical protein
VPSKSSKAVIRSRSGSALRAKSHEGDSGAIAGGAADNPSGRPASALPRPADGAAEQDVGSRSSAALVSDIGTKIAAGSLLFDPEWYRGQYDDVAAALVDPVRHYMENGWREGRNPNAEFDTVWYRTSYPDVASSGMNPFLHYLLYGAREGRRPSP